MIDILIALFVGAWFGIGFDLFTLDAEFDDVHPIHHYITEPARTIARAVRLLWNAIAE